MISDAMRFAPGQTPAAVVVCGATDETAHAGRAAAGSAKSQRIPAGGGAVALSWHNTTQVALKKGTAER